MRIKTKNYLSACFLGLAVFATSCKKQDLKDAATLNATLSSVKSDGGLVPINSNVIITGNVTNAGGGSVIERGICYTTFHSENVKYHSEPTVNHFKEINLAVGTGTFSNTLNLGLPSTTYRVRAYAITSVGVAYGKAVSFRTGEVKGERGNDGTDGAQGPAGNNGKDGTDGLQGLPGNNGKDGIKGKDGRNSLAPAVEVFFASQDLLQSPKIAFGLILKNNGGMDLRTVSISCFTTSESGVETLVHKQKLDNPTFGLHPISITKFTPSVGAAELHRLNELKLNNVKYGTTYFIKIYALNNGGETTEVIQRYTTVPKPPVRR